MAEMKWDQIGEKFYEMGVEKVGLFPMSSTGTYDKGVPWNGVTNVDENPDGAEEQELWADNQKYASFRSAEKFGGKIEAYMYPDEFEECDGSKEIAPGVVVGQQNRKAFGLVYRNAIGSDVDTAHSQYRLHLVYGATCSPSEKSHETINDNPDAETMSWDFDTVPVNVPIEGFNPTSHLTFDSRRVDKDKLKALETIIYGTKDTEPRLPLPEEVYNMFKVSSASTSTAKA